MRAFSASLEDVERSPYFKAKGKLPPKGTTVTVVFDRRPGVASRDDRLIGYLPTRYNYLKHCLEEGHRYTGVVSAVRKQPIAVVTVDIQPE